MKRLMVFFLSILLLSGFSATAQNLSGKIPVSPDLRIGTLSNGMKYYIKHNSKPENKVELRLAVNAGSILEDADQQGLAHFMEHMNFNGLEHFPGNELVHYLQSIGVSFGNDLNAYTGFDETVYILPVPTGDPEKVDKAFTVLADWAQGSLLTDEEIDKERGVILAESRLGRGADDRMMKIWLPLMLNGSKYAVRLPIGKDSIIENFDYSVLRRFYTNWYRPNLQAVIVVGDMPVDKAEALIREKFGDHQNPANAPVRQPLFEVKPFTENRAMIVTDAEADMTVINLIGDSHPAKPNVTEQDYLNKLIDQLTFTLLSNRLDELRNSGNPPFMYAYAYLGGWARGYENTTVVAACAPEGIRAAVQALVTECLRAKRYGFTETELKRAIANMTSQFEKQYNERDKTESGRLVWELVNNYLNQEAIPGIEWEYNFINKHLPNVSLKDLNASLEKIDIDEKYFSFVTTKTAEGLPNNENLKAWIDEALAADVVAYQEKVIASTLLKAEPTSGKITKTEKNDKLGTTTYTLSNGAIVCLKTTDFKNDEIIFKGSRNGGYSTYNGSDYQSAQFSNNVVEEMGYGAFSKTDLEKFLAGKVVEVAPMVDNYSENISGNCSVKDLETMFQLLYLVSTEPRNDMEAFGSFITRSKQQVAFLKQNPEYLFSDTLYNTLYQGNKRAHLIESADDFDKINPDHAIAFYRERICNPNGMYFTFVGSFNEETIRPLIEKYIGGIPAGPVPAGCKSIGLNTKPGQFNFTLHKGSEPKAMLVHYFTGPIRYDAEENFRLTQLNGVINNRIVDTIREKMGAIYGGGCYGSIDKFPQEEFLVQSYFPCSPDNIQKVDEAFMGLIEEAKKAGNITDKDWQRVREPALEKYRVDIKTNRYWLNNLQNARLYGNDPERILTVEQRLNALTPAQLEETARKFFTGQNILKGIWLPETK